MNGVASASSRPRIRIHPASPSTPDALVSALRACATSNLADCLPQVQVVTGLRPWHRTGGVLCGPALTVRVRPGDNLLAQHAIDLARPGDIIVVVGGGAGDRALVGELMCRYAHSRGVAGFVVDGAVRDLEYLSQGRLPVYARSVSPRGPTREGEGEINGEIEAGGVMVRPGDILVGDLDGVVCVPQSVAHAAVDACRRLEERERDALDGIRLGTLSRTWIADALKLAVGAGST